MLEAFDKASRRIMKALPREIRSILMAALIIAAEEGVKQLSELLCWIGIVS